MGAEIFDLFDLTDYTFLQISRGGVAGNLVVSQTDAEGVFKLRSGMVSAANQETRETDATLHIKPTEAFLAPNNGSVVGHGIHCQGKDYEVSGQTEGKNFDNGVLEFYRLTLKASDFSDYTEGS